MTSKPFKLTHGERNRLAEAAVSISKDYGEARKRSETANERAWNSTQEDRWYEIAEQIAGAEEVIIIAVKDGIR